MNDKPSIKQPGQVVKGPQTNVAGDVQGPVLSGQFNGPVAPDGEAVDLSGSKGTIYKPTYSFNISKPEEFSRLPTIPESPSDFTGRDEELKSFRPSSPAGTNIIGLRGIGRRGQDGSCPQAGRVLERCYPDGQIMVDMRGTTDPRSPMEAMGSVIRSYYREEKTPESEDETRQRYLEVLKGKRTLLLLDNALDDKQVQKLIPPKGCGLIITSRRTIKIPGLSLKWTLTS